MSEEHCSLVKGDWVSRVQSDDNVRLDMRVRSGALRARVWLGEVGCSLPLIRSTRQLLFFCDSTPEPTEGQEPLVERNASVEIWVPTGGRALYGALGVTFIPEPGARLACRIPWSHAAPSAEESARALPTWGWLNDTMHAGLPEEYVNAVAEGVRDIEQDHCLLSGSVVFTRALYGDVGSAPSVFRSLSRMVVQLAQRPVLAASVESLESFLHAEWRKRL